LKSVLFDSDVLLDVLAQRQPFVADSSAALDRATAADIQGFVAGHAVTNIFYILRRRVGNGAARALIAQLLQQLEVASITGAVIDTALSNPMTDFEDAVASEAAKAIGVDVIVTRNITDFRNSAVPAVLPADFIAMW
jgi:predicted nucleic acid-binding protein